MGGLTPENVGFITAFFSANPVAGFVAGMLILALIILVLGRQFRLGERNAVLDKATDDHIKRLNVDIEKLDKRLALAETAITDRDTRIAEMGGTIKFLSDSIERQTRDWERLKIENSNLQLENTQQKAEIQRLEWAAGESRKLIDTLTRKVETLEVAERRREFMSQANDARRKTREVVGAGEKIGEIYAPNGSPAEAKRDPRDSE